MAFAVAALFKDPETRPLIIPIFGSSGLVEDCNYFCAAELFLADISRSLSCPALGLVPPTAVLGAPLGLGAPVPPTEILLVKR